MHKTNFLSKHGSSTKNRVDCESFLLLDKCTRSYATILECSTFAKKLNDFKLNWVEKSVENISVFQ